MQLTKEKKKVLLVPLDPVHDVALKIINRRLKERGHKTILMPPDIPMEEVVSQALKVKPDMILISRTLGYGVAELLARFIDLVEAAGIREKVKIVIGGKAIKPELAAELGFDAGYGEGTDFEEVIAFVEGRKYIAKEENIIKKKKDITSGYSYKFNHPKIEKMLNEINEEILDWCKDKTSPGIKRAHLLEKMISLKDEKSKMSPCDIGKKMNEYKKKYLENCDESIIKYYKEGILPKKVRVLSKKERESLEDYIKKSKEIVKAKKNSAYYR